jgi:hypothetical protein
MVAATLMIAKITVFTDSPLGSRVRRTNRTGLSLVTSTAFRKERNMRKTLFCLLALIGVLLSSGVQAQNSPESFSPKLRSLTDLTPLLERKDLTALQRSEVLLMWLAEERRQPTKTFMGLGGEITSGYIQVQIIKGFYELGDAAVVEWIANAPQVADQGIRDGMCLALGIMGDRKQAPALLRILRTHPIGDFRALAAETLGYLGIEEAKGALQQAMQDPFTVKSGGHHSDLHTAYPVRKRAERALTALDAVELLVAAEERAEKFTARLKESKENARRKNIGQSRFIAIANRRMLAEKAARPSHDTP